MGEGCTLNATQEDGLTDGVGRVRWFGGCHSIGIDVQWIGLVVGCQRFGKAKFTVLRGRQPDPYFAFVEQRGCPVKVEQGQVVFFGLPTKDGAGIRERLFVHHHRVHADEGREVRRVTMGTMQWGGGMKGDEKIESYQGWEIL